MKKPKIVTIGGGTGAYIVLSTLKNYPVHLSAIVTMMDSGGSTGRLRDQLGILPPGDIRQALVALSESDIIWRKLFTYRFDSGDLNGHNFGNILLSALQKITASTEKTVSIATELLKTKGDVIPVTLEHATLCANYADGSQLIGEALIDSTDKPRPKITNIYLEPSVKANPKAIKAIEKADYIIFGPGDLYTSIIPNLLVDGISEALINSKAKKIYFGSLMTKVGQTQGFSSTDFITELLKYIGIGHFDFIFLNNKQPDQRVVDWYKQTAGAEVVKDNIKDKMYPNSTIVREDLLSKVVFEQSLSDRVKRSLFRHDSEKIAKTLMRAILAK